MVDVHAPFYEALTRKRQGIRTTIADRTTGEDARIAALWAEIDALEDAKAVKVADLSAKIARLDTLESALSDRCQQESARVWQQRTVALETPQDLIARIEADGGWRTFAQHIGATQRLQGDDLAQAARDAHPVRWVVTPAQNTAITRWARAALDIAWPSPSGPDEDPDSMIEQALNAA